MDEPEKIVDEVESALDPITRIARLNAILKRPQKFWISNRELPELERNKKIVLRNRSLGHRSLAVGEMVILNVESTGAEKTAYVLGVAPETRKGNRKTSSSIVEVTLSISDVPFDDFSCGGLLV